MSFPSNHFFNQPRPNLIIGEGDGSVDATTSATHGFGVDKWSGFMPPDPPINHLPVEWEPWEATLDHAMSMNLQLAVKSDLTEDEIACSASWREGVRSVLPVLSTKGLAASELLLRRAHHVLTFIMHIYIHTLPLDSEVRIPPSISIPILEVSAYLQLPPVATYSDTVLYNWSLKAPTDETTPPALDNLRSQDLFTGTNDEQEFYLASSRIEIRGVEALELMRVTMNEMFTGDDTAVRRITGCLHQLASVIGELTSILLDVRKSCDPEFFYHNIRPWLRGEDSDPMNRKWVFEGLDEYPEIESPTELSGPSAGQSTLIHALGIFLGLDNCMSGNEDTSEAGDRWTSALRRMRIYMPRHHRSFLRHLISNSRPVRDFVLNGDPKLTEAYDKAVQAVKELRDAHLRIVAAYVIGPANRERRVAKETREARSLLKGTGGMPLIQFLRGMRDKTAELMVGGGQSRGLHYFTRW